MMTDPIADMLTRLRNASLVRKAEVTVPYSKIKLTIAQILERTGYVGKVIVHTEHPPVIVVRLKYESGQPAFQHLRRISRPGQRHYVRAGKISKVLNGFGLAILSTPQGLLTDAEAREKKAGGELLCEIY